MKESVEIGPLTGIVVGSVDDRDLPQGAASYASNINIADEYGALSGSWTDVEVATGVSGKQFVTMEDGTIAVFNTGTNIKRLTGLPGSVSVVDMGAVSTGATRSAVSDGEAVHYGLGNAESNRPKWVGNIRHGQFGGSAPGWSVVDAEIKVDSTWATGSVGSWTPAEKAEDACFRPFYKYFWYVSFVYDGYQESLPVLICSDDISNYVLAANKFFGTASVPITITLDSSEISERITSVNLYRGEAPGVNYDKPTSDMYFVDSISINDSGWSSYAITYTDKGAIGNTFTANTGISPTLDHLQIHYGLSCAVDGYHIVGHCWHPQMLAMPTHIFRSKPYRYDTFDWSLDYMKLQTAPLALVAFAGRVYAFSEGRTYRIGAGSLTVEEEYVGIGAFGPQSVCVTDRGMFFANKDNIYWHNGEGVRPIGDSILTNQYNIYKGWLRNNHSASSPCVVTYVARYDMAIVVWGNGSTNQIWAFHIPSESWYHYDCPQGTILGSFVTRDGRAFVNIGSALYELFGSTTTRRDWVWVSNRLLTDGLPCTYYTAILQHDTGTAPTLSYSEDSTDWSSPSPTSPTYISKEYVINSTPYNGTTNVKWATAYDMRIKLEGTGDQRVNSLHLIRRRRTPR